MAKVQLWGLAAFVLPRSNARWPAYAIAPEVWPWLGLALVVIVLLEGAAEAFQWGGLLLVTAIYSLLMLRNSSWAGFPWLAVAALTGAGIAVVSACIEYLLSSADQGVFLRAFAAGNLVWANVLLGAVSLWRRYGEAISVSLGWRSHDLSTPFEFWSVVILSLWLVGLISAYSL